MSVVRLAVAPIAWSNSDMPELGGATPLETCLAESRLAGFSGVETGVKFPQTAAALAPLLAAENLRLASGWFSGLLRQNQVADEFARIRPMAEMFSELGAATIFFAETSGTVQNRPARPLSSRPRMAAADFPFYGKKLSELARMVAAETGVTLCYHHHMGTVVETESETDLLMKSASDDLGLLVDSGHMVFAGGDPVALLRRWGGGGGLSGTGGVGGRSGRVSHIHCKDLRAAELARCRAEDWPFMRAVVEGVFTVPGDGMIDFGEFIRAAAEIDYDGWLVVEAEQDPAKANPLEYSRRGGAHVRECCRRAGVRVEE